MIVSCATRQLAASCPASSDVELGLKSGNERALSIEHWGLLDLKTLAQCPVGPGNGRHGALGNISCLSIGSVDREASTQAQRIEDRITQGVDGLAIAVSEAAVLTKDMSPTC